MIAQTKVASFVTTEIDVDGYTQLVWFKYSDLACQTLHFDLKFFPAYQVSTDIITNFGMEGDLGFI